jgi:hypothetical protein
MIRVLRTELRRSSAFWIAPALVVASAGMLYLLLRAWGSRWMPLALGQRDGLYLLWPLAMGAGAWLGRRDRRSRMVELLGTTARPTWQRAIPTAGALSIALALGYVVTFAAAGIQVGLLATYFPLGSLPVVAIGALSLVAAGVFGLAIGRMVPSAFTPPVMTVLGLLAVVGPAFALGATIDGEEPAALLLSPAISVYHRDFVTIAPAVHAGQLLWFGGLAASGFALLVAVRLRDRLLALLPAGLCLALALAVLPPSSDLDVTDPDPKATALVCADGTPKVCVTTVHSRTLDELRDPGREALRILAAKLPQAPASVAESGASWIDEDSRPQPADKLLVEFEVAGDGSVDLYRADLIWELLDGAGARRCANSQNDHVVVRLAIAAWLLEKAPPEEIRLDGTDQVLQELRALPPAEQTRRVAEFRRASLACEDRDLTAIITGDAAR